MSFFQLGNAWTLIFPIAVLLYYFFRKRYTPKTISSTLFWESFMNETKASPYLHQLQKNALLLLQLLALFAFVFLLMKPYVPASTAAGQQVWFVIDTSASMETKTGDDTWFDAQKQRMHDLVDSHEGALFTLVRSGDTPHLVTKENVNSAELHTAIDALSVTFESEQLEKTLEFVKAGLPEEGAKIYVLTDAAQKDVVSFDQDNVEWHVENRKGEARNIALRQFGVTPSEAGTKAIVEIQNDTGEAASGTVEFETLDGQVIATVPFDVAAEDRSVVSAVIPSSEPFYKAVLIADDDYQLDNEMTAIVYRPVMKVAVDEAIHPTVQKALTAIGADVVTVPTDQLALRPEGELLITSDEALLEDATHPVLLIGRKGTEATEISGAITQKTPFSNYVDLSDIYVESVYTPIDGATTIATIGDQPFIQKLANGNLVVLTDIDQTDWPLHPSYPLFLWAAMEQFSEDASTIGSYFPNDRVTLASRYAEWSVYDTEGSFISDAGADGSITMPSRPGFYQITDGETEKLLAVQLEQQEKHISHENRFTIGAYQAEGTKDVNTSLIPFGILFILLVLLIEWEVQRRRGFTT